MKNHHAQSALIYKAMNWLTFLNMLLVRHSPRAVKHHIQANIAQEKNTKSVAEGGAEKDRQMQKKEKEASAWLFYRDMIGDERQNSVARGEREWERKREKERERERGRGGQEWNC